MRVIQGTEFGFESCFGDVGRNVREMFIPKGTIIIGKRHRYKTCNVLIQGEISVYMGEGIPTKRLKAPFVFYSAPRIRKLGYAHEDTIFCNIHPTKERDLDKIEAEFIVSEEEYQDQLEGGKILCLGQQSQQQQ